MKWIRAAVVVLVASVAGGGEAEAVYGGEVVAKGTPAKIARAKGSITGDYLSGKREISIPLDRRTGNGKTVQVVKATGNNLKNVTAEFPLGKFVCVTGVSGSGKSTLVNEVLLKALRRSLHDARVHPATIGKARTGLVLVVVTCQFKTQGVSGIPHQ